MTEEEILWREHCEDAHDHAHQCTNCDGKGFDAVCIQGTRKSIARIECERCKGSGRIKLVRRALDND